MKFLVALIKKEFFQIARDPSTFIIAFVMPLIILIVYRFGINLDTVKISMGIKNNDNTPEISTLVKSFGNSQYVKSAVYKDKELMYNDLIRGKLRGILIIPNDFSKKLSASKSADLLVISDGSETNLANYVNSYALVISNQWLYSSKYRYLTTPTLINTDIRYWYNQNINSHYFILPGSLAITMTLVGMLLTALVIAREWERGTMEALLSTQVKKIHIVLSKYIPYWILGMLSMSFNVFVCIMVFKIPFRGNLFVLFLGGGLFLLTCLGIGLLISTNFKDQFLASQTALALGFLPALMLSGLIFPINSMPIIFQWMTTVIPQRYFVAFVQSEFLAGTIPEIIIANLTFLAVLAMLLFIAVYSKTDMRMD